MQIRELVLATEELVQIVVYFQARAASDAIAKAKAKKELPVATSSRMKILQAALTSYANSRQLWTAATNSGELRRHPLVVAGLGVFLGTDC